MRLNLSNLSVPLWLLKYKRLLRKIGARFGQANLNGIDHDGLRCLHSLDKKPISESPSKMTKKSLNLFIIRHVAVNPI